MTQARERAHLRALPRCQTCGAAATQELRTGLNDPVGVYCARHAQAALQRFKEGKGFYS